MRHPYVGFNGRQTALVLGPSKYIMVSPEHPVELVLASNSSASFQPLADYPVLRWVDLYTAANAAILIPQSVKKVLSGLAADPALKYTLNHLNKESIMATAKKTAAAEATDAKAKNAAKGAKATAEKAPKAEAAAPAAKKAPAKAPKADAAPAKQATKKAAAAEAAEGRKGRPSPHALDAKIGKGKEDFKAHVREGSHRYNRYEFLVKNAGKTVEDVLGQEFAPGYPLVSKHITAALEEGYITLSK